MLLYYYYCSGLLNLIPEETDELLQRIDQPLTEEIDEQTVNYSFKCYNNRLNIIRLVHLFIAVQSILFLGAEVSNL